MGPISCASWPSTQCGKEIRNRLDQQPVRQLRGIHQLAEVAVIAGEQHMGLTGMGGPVDRPVFLGKISWTGDGGVVCDKPDRIQLMAELSQAIGSFAFEIAPRIR